MCSTTWYLFFLAGEKEIVGRSALAPLLESRLILPIKMQIPQSKNEAVSTAWSVSLLYSVTQMNSIKRLSFRPWSNWFYQCNVALRREVSKHCLLQNYTLTIQVIVAESDIPNLIHKGIFFKILYFFKLETKFFEHY